MKKNLLKVKCLCCGKTIAKYNLDTGSIVSGTANVAQKRINVIRVNRDTVLARTLSLCVSCDKKSNNDPRFTVEQLENRIAKLNDYIRKSHPDSDKELAKEVKRALTRISYEMKIHIILSQI